jgi:hypothetical protein
MTVMFRPKRYFAHFLLCFACSLATPSVGHSQSNQVHFERAEGKLPVTIVLAEGDGPPVIFRRATEPLNVIIINRSTNAEQLSGAIFSLLVTEARDPSGQERADNAALRMNMPRSTPQYGDAALAISRLHGARVRRVGSLGDGLRAIEVWVAPRRGHHRGR